MKKATLLPIIKLCAYIIIPIVVLSSPREQMMSGDTICLIKRFFGVECWGCGLTRAVYLVFRGELSAAWGYNRLIIVTIPLLLVLWVCGVVRQTKLLIKLKNKRLSE